MGTPPSRDSRIVDETAIVSRTRPGVGAETDPAVAPTRGDHEIAVRAARAWLGTTLPAAAAGLRRVAREHGCPGWDLEYRDERGDRVAVLVRETAAERFTNVEVSSIEWSSAKRLGVRYWLVLVADVRRVARIVAIQNPAGQVQDRTIDAHPTAWRLTWPALDGDGDGDGDALAPANASSVRRASKTKERPATIRKRPSRRPRTTARR